VGLRGDGRGVVFVLFLEEVHSCLSICLLVYMRRVEGRESAGVGVMGSDRRIRKKKKKRDKDVREGKEGGGRGRRRKRVSV
jgi:hypothetical protein